MNVRNLSGHGSFVAVNNLFGNHGIVMHAHVLSQNNAGIDVNLGIVIVIGISMVIPNGFRGMQKVLFWSFGINACFHGMFVTRNVVLSKSQYFSSCDMELAFHKIDFSNAFCNGMFDLQTRIHFTKIKS